MDNNITIREKLKVKDISQIICYHAEYYSEKFGWNHEFEAYVAKPLSELVIRNNERERIWIVEYHNKVAGSIALSQVDIKTAQLRWFILKEELRSKGIGKQLMEKLLLFARENNYKKVILWTASNLVEAITLYKKYGFVQKKEVNHFIWGKNVKELLFEKVL